MSELTDVIGEVCRLISADPHAETVAGALGEVVDRQLSAVEVRPDDAHFDDVLVVHDDDGTVDYIDLTLHDAASLEEFATVFGEYSEAPRVDYDRPRSLLFYRDDLAVIARVAEDRVSVVTVRRDA